MSGDSGDWAIAFAALYLRGLPRGAHAPRSRWRQVESICRLSGASVEVLPSVLASEGLWYEASVLQEPGVLCRAEQLVALGRVLTVFHSAYPLSWVQRLGASAPAALWQRGSRPEGPLLTIVGSRMIPSEAASFSRSAGLSVSESGGVVLSGGASGVDRAAVSGASCAAEVWPCGLAAEARPVPKSVQWVLSVCAPDEPFSSAAAFERNALLYAGASRSLVVAAELRKGGSFGGAKEALRRRLGSIFVRDAPQEPGLRALIALGGSPVSSPDAFPAAPESSILAPALFA